MGGQCVVVGISVDSVFDPLRDRGSRGLFNFPVDFSPLSDIKRKKARQRDFSSLDIRKGKNNARDISRIIIEAGNYILNLEGFKGETRYLKMYYYFVL